MILTTMPTRISEAFFLTSHSFYSFIVMQCHLNILECDVTTYITPIIINPIIINLT
jgi:hypothetical protein